MFVHCHLAVGNTNDPVPQGSRRRRDVGDHVTNEYSVAEDPLHLERGKREEKRGKDLDKSGMFKFKMEKKMMICNFYYYLAPINRAGGLYGRILTTEVKILPYRPT